MTDSNLTISQYNPLQQLKVRQWETFSPSDQLMIVDKIDLIIQTLNRLGKLSNDVVTDWNKVMQWVMNDGMTTEVDSQLQKWKDDGTLTTLINAYTGIGDLSTLQTVAKDSLVNAINENVGHLADIATNAKSQNVKGDGVTDDSNAFEALLNSNYTDIFLPSNFTIKITRPLVINAGVPKRVYGSINTKIVANFSTPQILLKLRINVSFSNIIFDFSNNHVQQCLSFDPNLGDIKLNNITIQNVYDHTLTDTFLIVAYVDGNKFFFDGISILNVQKFGDGTENHMFEGIYILTNATVDYWNGGYIKNVYINGFNRVDVNGTIIRDISNAIYLAGGTSTISSSNMLLENIKGYNFGKRLVKSQVSDLTIRNVYAESHTNTAAVSLGIQDLDSIRTRNVVVDNVTVRGNFTFGIAVSADDAKLTNIDIDIVPSTLYVAYSYGISLSGDNTTIDKAKIKANDPLAGNRPTSLGRGNVLNNKILNTTLIPIVSTECAVLYELTSNEKFDGLRFYNVTIDNTVVGISRGISAQYSSGNNHQNLVLENVTVINNSADTTNTTNMMNFINVDGITIRNFKIKNLGTGSIYRGININTAFNVYMERIEFEVPARNASVSLNNIDYCSIQHVKPNASSAWHISSTNTKLKLDANSDTLSKVSLNDTFALQNTFYTKKVTQGTTANRPPSPSVGDQHFDTTLNKPIWCKVGGASPTWEDAVGTTV